MNININLELFVGILVIIVVSLLLLYGGIFTIIGFQTEKACLSGGWRNYSVTWDFQKYCIREENEYEIVKPLNEL